MYETKQSQDHNFELKTIEVDFFRDIAEVSMKVGKSSYDSFVGIRLSDSDGYIIVEHIWCESSDNSKWVSQKVPEGQEIVGLQVSTED